MSYKYLRYLLNFLFGALWALLFMSAFLTFLAFFPHSLAQALFFTALVALFWSFGILFLYIVQIQLDKLDELKKQTELLEKIER